jgi:small basic protein (TIGR04137 family)
MSIHSSLHRTDKYSQQRSVLKRIERIKDLIAKGLWKEGDSVFGLPKQKIIKIKFKKEKAEKPEETTTAEAEATVASEEKIAAPTEKSDKEKVTKSTKDSKISS